MQWLVLVWAIFVVVVYIGGYAYPNAIGIHTVDTGKVYALILLIGVAASVMRWMAGSRRPAEPKAATKRRAKRSSR